MSTINRVKRGWKKYREDKDRINKEEIDTINDQKTEPWVSEGLKLGVYLTDLEGEQIKKIKKKK